MYDLIEVIRTIPESGEYIREFVNGSLCILAGTMAMVLISFVGQRYYNGWTIRSLYKDPGTKIAIALAIFTLGETIRSGLAWGDLHCQNFTDQPCTLISGVVVWVYLFASLLYLVGGMCAIRVLSADTWRPWSWILPGILAWLIPAWFYLGTLWSAG